MPRCACEPVRWKDRSAYRLTNGSVELTTLPGGGHIADFRLRGSSINTIWESPWPTIEPQRYSPSEHSALYGDGPAGRMLCAYTGHALALGYFGMPNAEEERRGLPLHGEAVAAEWRISESQADADCAKLTLEVESSSYSLRLRRTFTLSLDSSVVRIDESVSNDGDRAIDFQWVQHAAFGEPLFASGESSLILPATRGVTWPLDYEDRAMLGNNAEFTWPNAPTLYGGPLDLSQPFTTYRSGFVAAVLLDDRPQTFVAVHNRRLSLITGYAFERRRFPWVALWEENHARANPPWSGKTRVRGVEFGNSPMPLGLEWAKQNPTLLGTPTFSALTAGERIDTTYNLFVSPVDANWKIIEDVRIHGDKLIITEAETRELELKLS
jgi:hypothetical protein